MLALAQRLRPPALDVLLALALLAVVEAEVVSEHLHPYWASVPTFAVSMGVLAWRRRLPFAATLVGFAAGLIAAAAGVSQHEPFSPIFGVFVGLYSLTLYASPRRALAGLGYAIGAAYAQIAFATHYGESYGGTDFGFIAVLLLAPWLFGKAMRGRIEHIDVLALRAEKAEREREQRAREAAREERARIARELHDVIAHSVSVMVVQAGAARRVLDRDPDRSIEALGAVEVTGREALAEMRRLLGILRPLHASAEHQPVPSLRGLGGLVDRFRAAGLEVALDVDGEPGTLPPGVDLCAYRVVQEALTNAIKHSGSGRARVA